MDDRYVQATSNRSVTPIYVPMETKRGREKANALAVLAWMISLLDWARKVHDGWTARHS